MHTSPPQHPRGFTLIEILIVVAIMTVLLTLAASSAGNMLDTIRMRDAIQSVQSQFESARQTASTTNTTIVVRIYKEEDEFGVPQWSAIEFGNTDFEPNPDSANYTNPETPGYEPDLKPLSPIQRLPAGYIFHPSSTYSTLLNNTSDLHTGTSPNPAGVSREFVSFVILPDNRTNLPTSTNWTLTIVKTNETDSSALPDNYTTLELDPTTARIRSYRP